MSVEAQSISKAVQRLSRRDPTLEEINFAIRQLTDAELGELADCLLAHPDILTSVWLGNNQLTDETGVKLARYLAASSTIESLDLSYNHLGSATYLAMAAALRVNSSLREFYLFGNQDVDRRRIDAAFVEALRLNSDRPPESVSWLYTITDDFKRLRDAASELGHPSLLQLLLVHKALVSPPTASAESPSKRSDHRSCQVA